MCTHFVGFKGDEFIKAKEVFGEPDFIHRFFDRRAQTMFADGDTVVFANGSENKMHPIYSFDDSEVM